jgi:carbon storage regulator
MLVLTRNIGEEIVIGEQIRLTVVAIRGGQVRLGISAPASVRVDRREVRERGAMAVELPGLPKSQDFGGPPRSTL